MAGKFYAPQKDYLYETKTFQIANFDFIYEQTQQQTSATERWKRTKRASP